VAGLGLLAQISLPVRSQYAPCSEVAGSAVLLYGQPGQGCARMEGA
jgi:hypothetical protein